MSKSLLVGSVFASTQPQQVEWLELQSRYLAATTHNFDHVVFVNHADTAAFDGKVKVIGNLKDDPTKIHSSVLHLQGLNCLRDYFLSAQDSYDGFLFLDNDAFPVRKGWQSVLQHKMAAADIAVIVRPEMCEFRWHVSVLFVNKGGLNDLEFKFSPMHYLGSMGKDFLGNVEDDLHINYQSADMRDRVFPLLRTNQYNVHPVACGVYYDMFYHHTFGSEHGVKVERQPFASLRHGGKYGYGNFYTDPQYRYREFYSSLMEDPTGFIGKLAGWSKEEYPEIAGVVHGGL